MHKLATILADLFPDQESFEPIVTRAELDFGRVKSADKPYNFWFNAVDEAQKQGLDGSLIDVALEEYPNHQDLLREKTRLDERSAHPQGAGSPVPVDDSQSEEQGDTSTSVNQPNSPMENADRSNQIDSPRTGPGLNRVDGRIIESIHTLVVAAYTYPELQQFVRFKMDEELSNIAPSGTFPATVFELLGWVERNGLLVKFIDMIAVEHPNKIEDIEIIRRELVRASNMDAGDSNIVEVPKQSDPHVPATEPEISDSLVADDTSFKDLENTVLQRVSNELDQFGSNTFSARLLEACSCTEHELCSWLCRSDGLLDSVRACIKAFNAWKEIHPSPDELKSGKETLQCIIGWVVLLSVDPTWLSQNKQLLEKESVVFIPYGNDLGSAVAVSALFGKQADLADGGDNIAHTDSAQIRFGAVETGGDDDTYNALMASMWNKFIPDASKQKKAGDVLTSKERQRLTGIIEGKQLGNSPVYLVIEVGSHGGADTRAVPNFDRLKQDFGNVLPVLYTKPKLQVEALIFGESERLTGLLMQLLRDLEV